MQDHEAFVGIRSAKQDLTPKPREKHFANSLGWPLTLVLMGIAFLGVGAIAIKVKKRI